MDYMQTSFKLTNEGCPTDSNIVVQLRRLRLQEEIITKSIIKSSKSCQDDSDFCLIKSDNNNFSEPNSVIDKLKSTYIEMKNLFDEIKTNTSSQDKMKDLDIDDVKKDVNDLDVKIRTFKSLIQSELTSLKLVEQELNKQINANPAEMESIKRPLKIRTKPYNDVILSPVKTIMTSPFKCLEVQQFQEFMISSKNRYGGWIAYNHNIFEQTWQKYINNKNTDYSECQDINIKNNEKFQLFIQDVLQKIPGIMVEDIIIHSNWYSRYLYLKECQQRALNKWRVNKNAIRKVPYKNTPTRIERKNSETCSNGANISNLNVTVSDGFKDMKKLVSTHIKSDTLKRYNKNKLMKEKNDHKTTLNCSEGNIISDAENKTLITESTYLPTISQNLKSKTVFEFSQPTMQWKNRLNTTCDTTENSLSHNISLENIQKLRIPDWRLGLHAKI